MSSKYMSSKYMSSKYMSSKQIISVYFLNREVGKISAISVDMPWLYASIVYEDPEFGQKLETITHFVQVILEDELEDDLDDAEEDRRYLRQCEELGISDEDTSLFHQVGWELRCDECIERFYPHGFEHSWMQWRGPLSDRLRPDRSQQ